MPLPIPNLDDRLFDDLVEEIRSLIPRYTREWTDFNPADPGITLLELLAWLTEMIIFRINQIPPEHFLTYLSLIGISPRQNEDLQSTISRAVNYISAHYRLINHGDYTSLAKATMNNLHPDLKGRVVCVNDRNLELVDAGREKPGHISVILIPETKVREYCTKVGKPEELLLSEVKSMLNPTRLLTHRLHVVGPKFRTIRIIAELVLELGADREKICNEAELALIRFFDPIQGGQDNTGWPIGRKLFRSEVFEILEGTRGVDHVKRVFINGSLTIRSVSIGEFEFINIKAQIEERTE